MPARPLQAARFMIDMAVLIMMKMDGRIMMGHGFTAIVINKTGSKSKTATAMEWATTTGQIAVMQSLDLQEISRQALEINFHSTLVNTKITITTVMGIMKAIQLQATFARTITVLLTEIAMDAKTVMVMAQVIHQLLEE